MFGDRMALVKPHAAPGHDFKLPVLCLFLYVVPQVFDSASKLRTMCFNTAGIKAIRLMREDARV